MVFMLKNLKMKNVLEDGLTELIVFYDVVHNLIMYFLPEIDENFM